MTDAQLGILVAAIASFGGVVGGAIRWAVLRLAKSKDDGTAALVSNAASNATLVAKLDEVVDTMRGMAMAMGALTTKLDQVAAHVDEISDVHEIPRPMARRAAKLKTPPRGTTAPGLLRLPTKPGDDT